MPLAYVGMHRFILSYIDTSSHLFNHKTHLKINVQNLTRESHLPDPQFSDIFSLFGCLQLLTPKYSELLSGNCNPLYCLNIICLLIYIIPIFTHTSDSFAAITTYIRCFFPSFSSPAVKTPPRETQWVDYYSTVVLSLIP